MNRVLLIEADPGERLVLKSRLADLSYQVTAVETGAKGIVEARAGEHEAVLLAAGLTGGVDGAEVCRRIKAIPQLGGVPVLVYSNQPTPPEVAERMYDAGCEAFVSKTHMPLIHCVLEVQLRHRGRCREMQDQYRMLEHEARKLAEERQKAVDLEANPTERGSAAMLVRELAAGRPDGALIVDGAGRVRHADRGACEILGATMVGQTLGQIAPGVGLEAFVRDARTAAREGFRFEVSARKDRVQRTLMGSVIPVHTNDDDQRCLRVVLLLDVGKRRVAEELLRASGPTIPRLQLGSLLEAAHSHYVADAITGRGEVSVAYRAKVAGLISRNDPILLHGPKGSGKRHAGNILHYGGRGTGPVLHLRCGAMSGKELERELFGYTKGAFEGALVDSPGLLLLAQDGAVLLDDVDELSRELQQRLVEVLERRKTTRIGSRKAERVELRLIATTREDPDALVAAGRLDPDLRGRFRGGEIQVPTLAERIEDVPLLVELFLERFGPSGGIDRISDDAAWALAQYEWPGNVAELQDCIEQACARATGGSIELEQLGRALRDLGSGLADRELIPVRRPEGVTTTMPMQVLAPRREPRDWDISDEDPISLDHYEKKALLRALECCGGDKLAAARLLKVGKSTLYRKLKRFGIT